MYCLKCKNQDMVTQIIADEIEKIIKRDTCGIGEEDM